MRSRKNYADWSYQARTNRVKIVGCPNAENRKTKLEGFVFLLPFGVYSDKIITFAIRIDGTALPLSCYIVG